MKTAAKRNVFIQTTTFYYVGEVVREDTTGVTLCKASWVPDTGRFTQAMTNGTFNEVEVFLPEQLVQVKIAQIVAIVEWPHALPTNQK